MANPNAEMKKLAGGRGDGSWFIHHRRSEMRCGGQGFRLGFVIFTAGGLKGELSVGFCCCVLKPCLTPLGYLRGSNLFLCFTGL